MPFGLSTDVWPLGLAPWCTTAVSAVEVKFWRKKKKGRTSEAKEVEELGRGGGQKPKKEKK